MQLRIFAYIGFAALCACGMGVNQSARTAAPGPVPAANRQRSAQSAGAPSGVIQHVVVIIQENRSVDNLFQGFPNAATQSFGLIKLPKASPTAVPLQMIPLAVSCDISHAHTAWAKDYDNGKMDGFNGPPVVCLGPNPTPHPTDYAYSYVNPNDIVPYWNMASDYTLMDEVFEDPTSPSFQSHQHLIAGQSDNTSENPKLGAATASIWGCDSPSATRAALYNGLGDTNPGIFPCFSSPYETIADLLDAQGLTWKYYAPQVGQHGGIWSAFDAVYNVRYGPDWANVIAPQTKILTEAAGIPSVTYVVPSYADSDHAGSNSATGPAWVASVVNAIGTSSSWNSTAIFVLWDDWGGWYDHVAPTVTNNYSVGGFRVPVICISPYSENADPASPVVDHAVHRTDGILSFIEQNFNLGNLGAQDAVESPFTDCFNFNQSPQPFIPIASPPQYNANYFLNERPSGIVPDTDE
jgi:phospholipase C